MQMFIELLPVLIGAAVGLLVGMTVRSLILARLARVAARTATQLDDTLVGLLKGGVPLWGVLLGMQVGVRM